MLQFRGLPNNHNPITTTITIPIFIKILTFQYAKNIQIAPTVIKINPRPLAIAFSFVVSIPKKRSHNPILMKVIGSRMETLIMFILRRIISIVKESKKAKIQYLSEKVGGSFVAKGLEFMEDGREFTAWFSFLKALKG